MGTTEELITVVGQTKSNASKTIMNNEIGAELCGIDWYEIKEKRER